MRDPSRREFLGRALAAPAGLTAAAAIAAAPGSSTVDVHQQILDLAARHENDRRAKFAAVQTRSDLEALQSSLRQSFLRLLGEPPARNGVPRVRITGQIEAADYLIEKLVFESVPGYFVSALLYKPKRINARRPGVLSPCGHSTTGKAADPYQILHINLAKRGYVVLTYDPVGQGERSQFWDDAHARSHFNLGCGEHAVLGNPLYLLGSSLACYRIHDGMRGIDYLTSLPEVDATKIGCVGNSGGGTLSAYIAALDARVSVAAICCYITTLRRRMGNRIQQDPDADPEQDIFGFVSEGIDHAGLLAMIAPRPALLGTARLDFFPIEGARETFAEAKRLYQVAGAGDRIERAEADLPHGLSAPLRKAVYQWFARWLDGRPDPASGGEFSDTPRPARELQVCAGGQVNRAFQSRPLLPLALQLFDGTKKKSESVSLKRLLRLDPELANPLIDEIHAGSTGRPTAVVCVNGNESADWRSEAGFLDVLARSGFAVSVVDPRGVARRRPALSVPQREYADPLEGVEENIAYNAFLVGKSLLGMRAADVIAAVHTILETRKPRRVVLCARRDAALVACFAAAVDPAIGSVAAEEMILSLRALFSAEGRPINAASILPGLLQGFGDIAKVLGEIAPRRVLVSAGIGEVSKASPSLLAVPGRYSTNARILTDWIGE